MGRARARLRPLQLGIRWFTDETGASTSESQCHSARDAFLGAPPARPMLRFPGVSRLTRSSRASITGALRNAGSARDTGESERRPPVRLRYAIRLEAPAWLR